MGLENTVENETLDPYSQLVSGAFERVGPAVASIGAKRANERRVTQGSGPIYTTDGYLRANSHAIKGAVKPFAALPNWRA